MLDPAHLDAIVATVKQIPDWVDLQTRELVEQTLADTARAEAPMVVRRLGDATLGVPWALPRLVGQAESTCQVTGLDAKSIAEQAI